MEWFCDEIVVRKANAEGCGRANVEGIRHAERPEPAHALQTLQTHVALEPVPASVRMACLAKLG